MRADCGYSTAVKGTSFAFCGFVVVGRLLPPVFASLELITAVDVWGFSKKKSLDRMFKLNS